jgi:hypothetical protein
MNAESARLIDQIEQVRAGERVAAGENQLRRRVAEFSNLTQERDTLIKSKLHGVRDWRRFGAAVAARQCARSCDFPVDVHRGLRVISPGRSRGGAVNRDHWNRHGFRISTSNSMTPTSERAQLIGSASRTGCFRAPR